MQQPWQGHPQRCQALCMVTKLPCLCLFSQIMRPGETCADHLPIAVSSSPEGHFWHINSSSLQTCEQPTVRTCRFWSDSRRC